MSLATPTFIPRMGSRYQKRASVVPTLFWWIGLTLFTISTSATPTTTSITNNLSATANKINIMTNENGNKLSFLNDLRAQYPYQPTFLQSVEEIALSLLPLFEDPEKGDFYKRAFVAMTEPERAITFRVPWMDDDGNIQFNRGYRVEFSRFVGDRIGFPYFVFAFFYAFINLVFVATLFYSTAFSDLTREV